MHIFCVVSWVFSLMLLVSICSPTIERDAMVNAIEIKESSLSPSHCPDRCRDDLFFLRQRVSDPGAPPIENGDQPSLPRLDYIKSYLLSDDEDREKDKECDPCRSLPSLHHTSGFNSSLLQSTTTPTQVIVLRPNEGIYAASTDNKRSRGMQVLIGMASMVIGVLLHFT
ncbi:uncharacterized protein VTP21DRAFT_8729 [Calcarisporiella thermophila]|uniref:uncharacterized protein n=1 Tax=Calcarisporiella thermophila TaxID=911321 RepID=UPI0037441395